MAHSHYFTAAFFIILIAVMIFFPTVPLERVIVFIENNSREFVLVTLGSKLIDAGVMIATRQR
ncbi:hypothetical protein [Deinococcus sp. 6GRE01]|uniref:hypothetical protein n=1 Tax=Deinococcus sp. 6GRE01 TaxID=2745873 RepID=UPI001E537D5F|nr:hypothetical protein [Deinococcus sp. 6GRE01]MCD0156995.1 hypothetical protein [Deinococcus sp. 6GRE01]